jgi:hypothetical protein
MHAKRFAETFGGSGQMTRAQFDAMSPEARNDAVSAGTRISEH